MVYYIIIAIFIIAIVALSFVIIYQKKKITLLIEQTQEDIKSIQADAQEKVRSAQYAFEREKDELNTQHRKEINSILRNYELEKQRVKEQAKEEIESRRNVLSKMDDKEMLTNIMIALDGYGTRLNRIEQYYTDNKIIEQTNRMFQDTTSRIDEVKRSMENQLYDMCNSVDKSFNESDFKNKIEYICTYMQELDAATNDKITNYTTQMFQDLTYKVDGMTGRLTNQISEMNNSIEKSLSGSNVKNTIDNISSNIVELGNNIDEIKSSVCDGYGISIAEEIDDVKSNVESIRSDVDSVKSNVDSINSDMYSIKSDVDSVKSDIDSVKDLVDEIHRDICDEYSYDSLVSKIDEVKDCVSETKDIIESRIG